ncbi:base excision DNA repair protein [Ignicoccus hospitalis]|uniref:HhH-GPD family protein n=1 Tax=Ignicoccus hospitalis (strain KIN4/I / DSM 18386 / JCM 14125) TaxID=453591 RepID=A8A999_IGNH4|nr:base excision DNA repair protein [Ignicoccus hospitalis]ABU81501.1 HhH-GPD family protein [Ignicoccus hospitalis KIN4/I]HIH90435.1 hypothetical protein [Desulfurococcaceae archaeon]
MRYPKESLALYAFSWQFDGRCGYGELDGRPFKFCPPDELHGDPEVASKALGLHEDLDELYEALKGDPLLGCVAERYWGLRPRALGIWEAAVVGIAQQNASFKQAWSSLYKLHIIASKRINVFGKEYLRFPRPEEVDERALKAAGFGYRAKFVTALKEALRERPLTCSNVDSLKGVKGVGDYTLGLVKLFACRDYSAPVLDRWLKAVYEEAYGGLERYYEFGKWKGLVSLLTTVALDAVPLTRALERVRRGEVCPSEEPSPLTLWKYF